MKSSPLLWRYVVTVKSTGKISSIFVTFLENMNFTKEHNLNTYVGQNLILTHRTSHCSQYVCSSLDPVFTNINCKSSGNVWGELHRDSHCHHQIDKWNSI